MKQKRINNANIKNYKNQVGMPWYKYPWVWFIIALPVSAVIAGIITFYIAHNNAPQVIAKEHRFHINQK